MTGKDKVGLVALLIIAAILTSILLLYGTSIDVLNPKGPIAEKERDLIVIGTILSLIIVVPVFGLTFGIAWKYRASNKRATYAPDWDGHKLLETIWWGVPLVLITILSVIIYKSSHELDPFKPLQSNVKPLTIQVVALQWKWLFIYPEQDIASVNFVQFPEDRPINFEITADAPMNSFWIPSLGGQIYAMSGMSTKLHLLANNSGDYRGSSANISGEGFAKMNFIARASSEAEFEQWILTAKSSPAVLDSHEYYNLAKPSKFSQPFFYSEFEPGMYNAVIDSYMKPPDNSTHEMMGH